MREEHLWLVKRAVQFPWSDDYFATFGFVEAAQATNLGDSASGISIPMANMPLNIKNDVFCSSSP